MRIDPDHGRLVLPLDPTRPARRDPGLRASKINTAIQLGGPRLAVADRLGVHRHRRSTTSWSSNFAEFKDLIDKIGGIDVTVGGPILSKFDCPYGTAARCARWPGWRFAKGRQHLNGHRALIYSRVRKNLLNPAESDITRGERNQQVSRR